VHRHRGADGMASGITRDQDAGIEIGTGIGTGDISIACGAWIINANSVGSSEVGIDMSATVTVGDASMPSVSMTGLVDSTRSTVNQAGESQ
jgi:hypothetical protein